MPKNAVFTNQDINRAAWVGFEAGFKIGQSGMFKTSRAAWESVQKMAARLRNKKLARKR